MKWNSIFENIGKDKRNVLIKAYVNSGPIKLENEIRKILEKKNIKYLVHHWSPYSQMGLMEIGIGKSKIYLEWYVGKEDAIIYSGEIERYDVEGFDEFISSGNIESSVLRLMRNQY